MGGKIFRDSQDESPDRSRFTSHKFCSECSLLPVEFESFVASCWEFGRVCCRSQLVLHDRTDVLLGYGIGPGTFSPGLYITAKTVAGCYIKLTQYRHQPLVLFGITGETPDRRIPQITAILG